MNNSAIDNLANHAFELAGIAITGVLASGVLITGFIFNYKGKRIEADKLKQMPEAYWLAKKAEEEANALIKKAEAEASVKKHEIDVSSNERLAIDHRERKTKEQVAKLEFEQAAFQSAPPEYWEMLATKAKAENESKTALETARLQAQAEKNAADAHARAITSAAREIRQAING